MSSLLPDLRYPIGSQAARKRWRHRVVTDTSLAAGRSVIGRRVSVPARAAPLLHSGVHRGAAPGRARASAAPPPHTLTSYLGSRRTTLSGLLNGAKLHFKLKGKSPFSLLRIKSDISRSTVLLRSIVACYGEEQRGACLRFSRHTGRHSASCSCITRE